MSNRAIIEAFLATEQRSDDSQPLDRVPWYALVAAPLPVSMSDDLFVTIPDIEPFRVWGPCRWNQSFVPVVGSECLVIFDNRQNPWVVMMW